MIRMLAGMAEQTHDILAGMVVEANAEAKCKAVVQLTKVVSKVQATIKLLEPQWEGSPGRRPLKSTKTEELRVEIPSLPWMSGGALPGARPGASPAKPTPSKQKPLKLNLPKSKVPMMPPPLPVSPPPAGALPHLSEPLSARQRGSRRKSLLSAVLEAYKKPGSERN